MEMKKGAGGDAMVQLRDAALRIEEIIKKADAECVTVYVNKDGYVAVRAGEYEYAKIEGLVERIEWQPSGRTEKWRHVHPAQIAGLTEPPEGEEW